MAFELSDTNAVEYLASRGLVQASAVQSVELLGWGVSNTLVKVCAADDCLVVKQSLPRLRVTAQSQLQRKIREFTYELVI